METNSNSNQEVWDKAFLELRNEDPDVRRRCAEQFISEPLSEELLPVMVELLEDPDKGVRDASCMALTYNENEAIPSYVTPLIASPEISVRNIAGDILLKRGTSVIPALLDYLPKGNDDDQKFLIDIMGLIGEPAAVPAIIKTLKMTENDNVSLACLEALGNIKSPDGLPHLKDAFFANELFGPTIVEALGKIGNREAADFITENYAKSDDLTKFSMLESMGQLGDENTFYFLLGELKSSTIPYTWAIVRSLQTLRERCGLDIPYDEVNKQMILATLMEGEREYRLAASSLVVAFKDADVLKSCITIYGKDPEIDANIYPYLCENGVQTLRLIFENLGDAELQLRSALELLKSFLMEWDAQVLKSFKDMEIVNLCNALTEQLSHPDEEVRKLVMELLFIIKPDLALVFADKMSSDINMWNRIRFVELIEQYAASSMQEVLKPLLSDSESMVVERVQWALGIQGNQ